MQTRRVELPMLTSGPPRGILWLIGGTLTIILSAVVNRLFHDWFIAAIVGTAFAVTFGAVLERVINARKRDADSVSSLPLPQVPADEVRAGDKPS
jgi:hypothetical protein